MAISKPLGQTITIVPPEEKLVKDLKLKERFLHDGIVYRYEGVEECHIATREQTGESIRVYPNVLVNTSV